MSLHVRVCVQTRCHVLDGTRGLVEPSGGIHADPCDPEWQLFVVGAILSPPPIVEVRLNRSPRSVCGHLVGADTSTPPYTCPSYHHRGSPDCLALVRPLFLSRSVSQRFSPFLSLSYRQRKVYGNTTRNRQSHCVPLFSSIPLSLSLTLILLDGSYSGNHKKQRHATAVLALPFSSLYFLHLSLTSIPQRANYVPRYTIMDRFSC